MMRRASYWEQGRVIVVLAVLVKMGAQLPHRREITRAADIGAFKKGHNGIRDGRGAMRR